jgi:vacuolar protein sorting-associated protein IST1
MRKEIAQFLVAGQEPIARIRVEHVIREQNVWEAYEILEMFCEFILARVPILETQRECPPELREAVASVIFAAPRCSDLPDLLQIRNLFTAKYGKEFIAAATELRPDTSVNRTIIEKLSIATPSAESRLSLLKAIAQEHNVEWDSSRTEAEFSKKTEDLLNGPKQISSELIVDHPRPAPKPIEKSNYSRSPKKIEKSLGEIEEERSRPSSSHVLEKARAAMASADRASAAARAAADLVNLQFGSFKLQQERSK